MLRYTGLSNQGTDSTIPFCYRNLSLIIRALLNILSRLLLTILLTTILATIMTRKNRHSISSFSSSSPNTTVTLPASAVPAPETLDDGLPLPKLIVFDLDYTLWPFWVDTHVSSPLKPNPKDASGLTVRDAYGSSYGFYKEVAGIVGACRDRGIKLGLASRTCAPDLAHQMLSLLRVPSASAMTSSPTALSLFDFIEMYPGSKRTHFQRIQKESGLPYEEMLFFDDESRNRNVEDLGVVMQLVPNGVTRGEVEKGVESWRKRNNRTRSREG